MDTKPWYKSITMWVGIAEVLSAALIQVATFLKAGVFTADAIIMLIVGIVTIVLRLRTKVGIQ